MMAMFHETKSRPDYVICTIVVKSFTNLLNCATK